MPDYLAGLNDGVKGLKLGVPKEYFGDGIDPGVRDNVEAAIQKLAAQGAEIVEISLPHTEHAVATYYVIAPAEASSNLSRFDGIRYGHRAANPADILDLYKKSREEGFGPEVKRRIILGTYVLSSGYYDAYYSRAQKVRTLIRRDFENAFQQVDAILSPVAPTPARKIGASADDPLQNISPTSSPSPPTSPASPASPSPAAPSIPTVAKTSPSASRSSARISAKRNCCKSPKLPKCDTGIFALKSSGFTGPADRRISKD